MAASASFLPAKRRVVLLGPPAAGKGTQATLIEERYQIPVVSTGGVLRKEKEDQSALGLEAERFTREGRLIPDEIALRLVECWLEEHSGGFVLDGFPRSIPQAEGLCHLLEKRRRNLEAVIFLRVEDETIRRRVVNRRVCGDCGKIVSIGVHVSVADATCPACGGELQQREDDNLETLERRLVEYREKTEPLVSYYEGRDLLTVVEAGPAAEVVFREVSRIMEGL